MPAKIEKLNLAADRPESDLKLMPQRQVLQHQLAPRVIASQETPSDEEHHEHGPGQQGADSDWMDFCRPSGPSEVWSCLLLL
jgi:hypothetical protein